MQALTFASLPSPPKYKPMEGCDKSLYMSETQDERTIGKSTLSVALLLLAPNTREEVTPQHPLVQSPLNEF